jgi:hypothetical protein
LHSDKILIILDELTTTLGSQLRSFQKDTCSGIKTYELKRETAARQKRQAKKDTKSGGKKAENVTQKVKAFNLNTYKVHALGDYVDTIRVYGTTDSYSTEPVI